MLAFIESFPIVVTRLYVVKNSVPANAISLHHFFNDLNAQPWSLGRAHPPLDVFEGRDNELVLHRVLQGLHLEASRGRRREGSGQARRRGDGARPSVGIQLATGGLNSRRNLSKSC